MSGWILRRSVALVIAAPLLAAACGPRAAGGTASGAIPFPIAPAKMVASSPDLLALGKKTFEKECVACHGAAGNGEGDAAYLLYPRPRDFTSGLFRIISTWDNVPSDVAPFERRPAYPKFVPSLCVAPLPEYQRSAAVAKLRR